jgi:integrase
MPHVQRKDAPMPLTDTAIKNIKPSGKANRFFDGGGLYLEVSPIGGKLWRLKYRFEGKEKRLALGAYPVISLKDARERRDEAKKLLAKGVDPGAVKKAQKAAKQERAANSFEVIAREWFGKWETSKAESHSSKVMARLEKDVFPWMGGKAIAEITAPDVLAVLRRIESRGTLDTAHRAGGNCAQVFRYAIATGRVSHNPVPDLRGALPSIGKQHFPTIIDSKKIGELLRSIDDYMGSYTVRAALKLLPLVFCRPGELRLARWADIDLEKAEWKFTANKTKTEHLVPLSKQALAILEELHPLTGCDKTGLIFPGQRPGRPLSNAALNAALRNLGYDTRTEITGHGFRAMARTLLAEELNFPAEVIEHQLAHSVPDALGTAYNRTKFLRQRKEMMQSWADYLDKLKVGAEVIPLRGTA